VSSTIDRASGIVTISAPCYSWAPVGHRLAVVGSASEYGIKYADWVLRHDGAGRCWPDSASWNCESLDRPRENGSSSVFGRHRGLPPRVGRHFRVVRVIAPVRTPAHDPHPRLALAYPKLAVAEILTMFDLAHGLVRAWSLISSSSIPNSSWTGGRMSL
jgi:hypothetical protein